MVYVTGDTHRNEFCRIKEFCEEYETTTDDVMVILGDAGINYYGEPGDSKLKRELVDLPITLLCIHGNHEKRPESIRTYDETDRFGGAVYWEPKFPTLLFAKCGEIYELGGNRCLVIGGANSIDKYYRTEGVNWWADEQPSDYIKDRVEARLDKEKYPDILVADEEQYKAGRPPFYTNSSQLPVNYTDDIFEILDLQDETQSKYTGGTVLHMFMGEKIKDTEALKSFIKKVCHGYRLPYFSITPTFSVCPKCGYLEGEHFECPKCKAQKIEDIDRKIALLEEQLYSK